MPPALVLETSCLRVNLRVTVKSGPYNNKEKDHQITYLCKRGKKKKKTTRKLTILRMIVIILGGRKWANIYSLVRKNIYRRLFLKKKIF